MRGVITSKNQPCTCHCHCRQRAQSPTRSITVLLVQSDQDAEHLWPDDNRREHSANLCGVSTVCTVCLWVPVSVHNEENHHVFNELSVRHLPLSQKTAGTCRCMFTATSTTVPVVENGRDNNQTQELHLCCGISTASCTACTVTSSLSMNGIGSTIPTRARKTAETRSQARQPPALPQ